MKDKRTTFLLIYALIIVAALIYILFIAPESNFYSKETKEFIEQYEESQNQTIDLNDMFEHLEANNYSYVYNILDSINDETTIYKCSGTVKEDKESGSCTEPNDIVYDETNKSTKLKELNQDLMNILYIKEITENNEATTKEYDGTTVYKYNLTIDTLSTDIEIYTNKSDIEQISVSNAYETYVIKLSDINY